MIIEGTDSVQPISILALPVGGFTIEVSDSMAGLTLNFPNAITDERYFYGRQRDLRRIEDSLLQQPRVPVLVIGERRTGKTSLMNVAVRRLEALNSQSPVHFTNLTVEPRGINNFSAFARSILLSMRACLWRSWPDMAMQPANTLPAIESINQFEIEFTNLLQYSGREIFLICIDEFDEIVRQVEKDEVECSLVFGLIRYLVEHSHLPVAFFFTMTAIPEVMREKHTPSMIGMAEVLELGPLESEVIARLAEDVSINALAWPEEQLKQFCHLCGGYPYIAKLVLKHLLSSCMNNHLVPVDAKLMETAVQMALSDPRTDHVLEKLYKLYFSEQEKEVLLLLAQRNTPLSEKELGRFGPSWVAVAKRLEKRHYLVKNAECFDFQAAFLGEWLRNWIAFEEECAVYTTLSQMAAVPNEIVVDIDAGQVTVLGVPVRLSAQEFHILDYLSARAGQLVHREELIEHIWETDQGVTDQVVDTAFYRLRKKIGDRGHFIETIPSQGFRLHRAARKERGGLKGGDQ